MLKKLAKIKKEDFIRITPLQFTDLMTFCSYYHNDRRQLEPEYYYTNLNVMSDIYLFQDSKSKEWEYAPKGNYKRFKLSFTQFLVLADELLQNCPSQSLNDILHRLDLMFINAEPPLSLQKRQELLFQTND